MNSSNQLIPENRDTKVKSASVLWWQDEDTIGLTIYIPDLARFNLKMIDAYGAGRGTMICFESVVPEGYAFNLRLLGRVLPLDPKDQTLIGSSLTFKLKKLSAGLEWPYLTEENLRFPWLKSKDQYFEGAEYDSQEVSPNLGKRYFSALLASDIKEAKEQDQQREAEAALGERSSEDSSDAEAEDADFFRECYNAELNG